ncbi:hypothetical protein ALP22_101216 [Pseudomonas coronafaciens pv. porri]|nr:hypothetical protein ALQ61_100589 [Pseudomonas coronafaciens pv. zizaniae]RMU82442.1 hypothetical protein ALP22_101216 [Pseudomonas coronafaciens pv. porri]RMV99588.1 hypothetical protein ALP00_101548 [Pseudomonas coronafaciens pv. porri]RMW01770.1 hypothetical protein ALO99_101153 [Pseudomonas coronafaciens pv. porri]
MPALLARHQPWPCEWCRCVSVFSSILIMGIGLATGAPDTHLAPISKGRQPENSLTPGRLPDRGFCFFRVPNFQLFKNITLPAEDHDMKYTTYYRNDIDFAWRFSNLRSGQPAASDRSLPGGNRKRPANTALCRTPQ